MENLIHPSDRYVSINFYGTSYHYTNLMITSADHINFIMGSDSDRLISSLDEDYEIRHTKKMVSTLTSSKFPPSASLELAVNYFSCFLYVITKGTVCVWAPDFSCSVSNWL